MANTEFPFFIICEIIGCPPAISPEPVSPPGNLKVGMNIDNDDVVVWSASSPTFFILSKSIVGIVVLILELHLQTLDNHLSGGHL